MCSGRTLLGGGYLGLKVGFAGLVHVEAWDPFPIQFNIALGFGIHLFRISYLALVCTSKHFLTTTLSKLLLCHRPCDGLLVTHLIINILLHQNIKLESVKKKFFYYFKKENKKRNHLYSLCKIIVIDWFMILILKIIVILKIKLISSFFVHF